MNSNKQLNFTTKTIFFVLFVILTLFIFKLFFFTKVFTAKIQIATIFIMVITVGLVFVWKKMVPDSEIRERQKNKAINIWVICVATMVVLQMLIVAFMFLLIFLGII